MAEHAFLSRIEGSGLQAYITKVRGYANELTIEVKATDIFAVMKMLKEQYAFDYFVDIVPIDHYTDEQRFELCYNVVSLEYKQRLRISTRLEEDHPEVESVCAIYPGADWNEREAFDMMGIKFKNHPDLRRMFMPEDFQYYPLRKEFPLLGIPGSIQMPEKADRTF